MRTPLRALAMLAIVAGCGPSAHPATDAGSDVSTADAPIADAAVPDATTSDAPAAPASARVIVASRDGELASLDLAPPHAVRATVSLGATLASLRCRESVCVAVLPTPADRVEVLDAITLATLRTITLDRASDPRDAAFVDAHTVAISLDGSADLLVADPTTGEVDTIDLGPLADADGRPEARRLAHCGERLFVQLLRLEHATGTPSALPAVLGVVDLGATPAIVDVDPATAGVQGVALSLPPAFDMPVDCAAGTLWLAEPRPLMSGGGRYEQVDLDTLVASPFGPDVGAEIGGFEVISPELLWMITHTEFGPGASSHLVLEGASAPDTVNSFSGQLVDDLAVDRAGDRTFFPDPCTPGPTNPSCVTPGLVVLDATEGTVIGDTIDVGFDPVEVAIAPGA